MPLEKTPGLISMRAGNPNSSTFPFTSIQLTARSPTDPTKEEVLTLGPKELETALQYGPTGGIPSLLEWVWGLQELSHGRKRNEGWRPSVGAGSQDVIYKVRGYHDRHFLIIELSGSTGCQLDFEPWGHGFGGIPRICVRAYSNFAERKKCELKRILVVSSRCSKLTVARWLVCPSGFFVSTGSKQPGFIRG